MLKYEGKFKVGQTIKAYDFQPIEGRGECYIEGVVIGAEIMLNGTLFIPIVGTKDVFGGVEQPKGERARIGDEVYVPCQIAGRGEYEGRVTLVAEEVETV